MENGVAVADKVLRPVATTYQFVLEHAWETVAELDPLYAQHYAEMQARLKSQGIETAPYAPRYDAYKKAADEGYLLTFVVRLWHDKGVPVGYSNIYLTNDMHNGELIAREDTIYLLPEHRNGVGRKFSKAILAYLRERGVKRLHVTALTDMRVEKLWKRMGFKPIATTMIYTF